MAEPGYCDHGTPGGDIGGCRLCKNAAREKHVHDTLNGFLKKHPDYFMSWVEKQDSVMIYKDLLDSLVDESDCRFDHHGGCQEHGYLSLEPGELCPQEEIKRILHIGGR